uniref:Putative secreted peptide n=1 Tax=Anopheles braziliensis TaxID=58242 RepID=A0A2M3ZP97_9DIPT
MKKMHSVKLRGRRISSLLLVPPTLSRRSLAVPLNIHLTSTDETLDQLRLATGQTTDGGFHQQGRSSTATTTTGIVVDTDTDRMQWWQLGEAFAQQIGAVQVRQKRLVVHVERDVESLRVARKDRYRMIGTVVMMVMALTMVVLMVRLCTATCSSSSSWYDDDVRHASGCVSTANGHRSTACASQHLVLNLCRWKWC